MEKLKKAVLDSVKPSREEVRKLNKIAESVLSRIKIKGAKPQLGGSVAKGTWLKGNHDIDIYVKFDPKMYAGKDLSVILKKALKKIDGLELVHGSRDYFQAKMGVYTIEIVPILNIRNVAKAENITDVSPFHVKWVRKHKELCDEMRLSKALCKANKIYGAESYIKGFSGYVLEILTAHYGGFVKLLRNVVKWKGRIVIDVENYYSGKDVLKELNVSKIFSPLVLIDPVQKERNAAAGLSKEKYNLFKKLAEEFLKNPSESFFVKKEVTINDLNKLAKGKKLVLVEASPLKGKKDVVGAKLLKCFKHVEKHLKLEGFEVMDAGWEWEKKALFHFIFEKKKLSVTKKHFGPPRKSKNRLENFKAKWKGKKMKFEKGLSYVVIKRSYREPEKFIKDFIKNDYVKQKVKSIKLI